MKRLLAILTLSLGMLLVAPAPEAAAWSGWNSSSRGGGQSSANRGVRGQRPRARRQQRSGRGTPSRATPRGGTASHGVPELDPGAAGSALVLLFGGIAYIASRRREDSLA